MANTRKEELVVRNAAGELELIDLLTGEVITNQVAPAAHIYAFDYSKAVYICQKVREGKTMLEISRMPEMPPIEVITHWQRTDRMFAEELKIARKERGEAYHDRVIELAEQAAYSHKDAVAGINAAINAFKWAAERNLPDRYGTKVVHEGSEEKPIVMRVLNTGIIRQPRNEVIEVVNTGDKDEQERGTEVQEG